ncbi:MAG: hypothetical protein KJ884_13655 [Gammaproteobacteria bacterium]|nr:hypothetical protein [Gammaproteobacteria bacterium]MBU1488503.1 hypothetical protein [Gammaproteobacteria bacterium]MBU2067094.1 hypothetical protein [Gammaproteobacteria bacterium]MBU2138073.1 hypothetical protein [Gammaproteobacteria bacterium]MBU2216050.1 hypothetical protein [Gammaproteobacteria bacterium]
MLKRFALLVTAAAVLQGCGVSMTRYEPNFDNVQILKQQAPLSAMNAPSVVADKGLDSISVRTNPIRSPDGSLSKHVQQALEAELRLAGLLEPTASRHLDVQLRQNSLTAGMGSGEGVIGADFKLSEGSTVLYSGSKTVTSTWDSSFVGAIAIPAAANAYNPLVRKLLAELYQDPAFIKALKQ